MWLSNDKMSEWQGVYGHQCWLTMCRLIQNHWIARQFSQNNSLLLRFVFVVCIQTNKLENYIPGDHKIYYTFPQD